MMRSEFAKMYGTPGHDEEQEKVAQAEVFAKLAASESIDLNQLTDEQVAELWDATFSEDASEEKTAAASTEELYEQAQQEFSGVASETDMQKQADAFGRQAAHSFYAEMQEIEKAGAGKIENLKGFAKGVGQKVKEVASKAGKAVGKETGISDIAGGASGMRRTEGIRKAQKRGFSVAEHKPDIKTLGKGVGKASKTLAAGAGLGLGAQKALEGTKQSAALDQLAGQLAFEKAAEAQWDSEEAAERLNAILTLGAGESEKIAHAENTDQAIEIRSLELLELAGYPVTWEE